MISVATLYIACFEYKKTMPIKARTQLLAQTSVMPVPSVFLETPQGYLYLSVNKCTSAFTFLLY